MVVITVSSVDPSSGVPIKFYECNFGSFAIIDSNERLSHESLVSNVQL